jgi:hypothetical protein
MWTENVTKTALINFATKHEAEDGSVVSNKDARQALSMLSSYLCQHHASSQTLTHLTALDDFQETLCLASLRQQFLEPYFPPPPGLLLRSPSPSTPLLFPLPTPSPPPPPPTVLGPPLAVALPPTPTPIHSHFYTFGKGTDNNDVDAVP